MNQGIVEIDDQWPVIWCQGATSPNWYTCQIRSDLFTIFYATRGFEATLEVGSLLGVANETKNDFSWGLSEIDLVKLFMSR